MFDLNLATLISRLIIVVIALTVHEFAHAWTADRFGDDTPRIHGRLTLNPISHLDPIGSLLFLVAGFGWARPVPVNPYALQRNSSAAPMWVAIAGPLSNLGLALVGSIPYQIGVLALSGRQGRFLPTTNQFLQEFILLNLVLCLFNLLPIFPLDGEKVLLYLAPSNWARTLEQIRPYGPLILIAVVFLGPYVGLDILSWIVFRPALAVFTRLV